MIPNISLLNDSINDVTYPTRTYKLVITTSPNTTKEVYYGRVKDYTDGLQSVEQAIHLILSTERYKFPIYSWDYGVELFDLFGKPMPFVKAELPERIKEALLTDERITDVNNFSFEQKGNTLSVTFTVSTNAGDITSELEVEV